MPEVEVILKVEEAEINFQLPDNLSEKSTITVFVLHFLKYMYDINRWVYRGSPYTSRAFY